MDIEFELTTYADLRNQYLNYLGAITSFGGKNRPRVRHIEKWKGIQSTTIHSDFKDLTQHNGNIFCWSDLHFGHKNIIEFSDRPYPDTTTMNEHLVANYNEYVTSNDVCIWVGDVAFMSDTKTNELLAQCKGYNILVVGNHDFDNKKLKKLNFNEIHLVYTLTLNGINMVFTHYPMTNIPKDWFHVHGHEHIHTNRYDSEFKTSLQHINVCCELHNYKPLNMNQIIDWCKLRKTQQHDEFRVDSQ